MSKFKFFAAFSKEKMEQVSQSLTEAIVSFDPETASEAAISMIEDHVDEMAKELAVHNQALHKERNEADAAKANYNEKLGVATALQTKIDDEGTSAAKRKSLKGSLDKLLEDLEDTRADVEMEIQEAEDAQSLVDTIQETLDMAVQKLKTARRDFKKATGDMKRAEMSKRRSEADEAQSKKLAGVTNSNGGLDVALDAMRNATVGTQAEAEAAQLKADLIKPFDAKEDKNIADVMAEINGTDGPVDTGSRVANLSGF